MAELKTKATDASVQEFLDGVADETKRADCREVLRIMTEATGAEAKMWGANIVGFGTYRFKYASGRTGEWMLAGFAPRKRNLTLYIMPGFSAYGPLMERLGKHKTGKSCLYLNKLADVDVDVLEELIVRSVEHMRSTHSDTEE